MPHTQTRPLAVMMTPGLQGVEEANRAVMRAGARVEAAKRELDAALDGQRDARTALRRAVRAARDEGETLPRIAAVLRVSTQRVGAILAKPLEVSRR